MIRVQAKVVFASLKEIDTTAIPATATSAAITLPRTSYSQAGGGIKISLDGFIGGSIRLIFRQASSARRPPTWRRGRHELSGRVGHQQLLLREFVFQVLEARGVSGGMELINNQLPRPIITRKTNCLRQLAWNIKSPTDRHYWDARPDDVTHTSDDPAKIGIGPVTRRFQSKKSSAFFYA